MIRFTSFIVLLFALFALGCATTNKDRAVQLVAASDVVADEMAAQWAEQARARIKKCRAEGDKTKEERDKCLGKFATLKDDFEAGMETLVAAQMAVKLAVECDSNPIKTSQEFLAKCGLAKKADWKALQAQVMKAWDALRPLFQEIRKGKK